MEQVGYNLIIGVPRVRNFWHYAFSKDPYKIKCM